GVNEHLSSEHRYESRLDALQAARDWIFENLPEEGLNKTTGSHKPATA
ncbi:MAG: hypothetical protein RLZZ602_2388, partial [Pseudomonadota bacterium]